MGVSKKRFLFFTNPIGSMYGIFIYIRLIFMVPVGKYTIHGSYGNQNKHRRFGLALGRCCLNNMPWLLLGRRCPNNTHTHIWLYHHLSLMSHEFISRGLLSDMYVKKQLRDTTKRQTFVWSSKNSASVYEWPAWRTNQQTKNTKEKSNQ